MPSADNEWWGEMEKTIGAGRRLIHGVEEFNRVCDHIAGILSNAAALFLARAAPTAAFLAITALEETAKARAGIFRRSGEPLERTKDPLYRHGKKQVLAAAPTVAMGTRLHDALGPDRVKVLMVQVRTGELVGLRECCIYFDRPDGQLQVPTDLVSRERARELLLFSIEAFDDALVGYTNHSIELSYRTDELFAKVAA